MKNIDIITPQNVTVRYRLAGMLERAIAFALDFAIMSGIALLISIFLKFLVPFANDVLMYFTVYPFVILYSLGFEQFNNGQSIGKKVMSIRVIRLDGEHAGFFDYLMRWIFRSVDIYGSLGTVAAISIVSSHYNQRLGDLLANTVVVNITKTERMRLKALLKLNKFTPPAISYPQVARLNDEIMMLVKETLARKSEFSNPAHDQAFDLLIKELQTALEIKAPANKHEFLKTLLNDYIALTR